MACLLYCLRLTIATLLTMKIGSGHHCWIPTEVIVCLWRHVPESRIYRTELIVRLQIIKIRAGTFHNVPNPPLTSQLGLHGNLLVTTHITLSYYRAHNCNTDEQERCIGCSNSAIRLRGERQRNSWFLVGSSDFLPFRNVETDFGPIQPVIQWVPGGSQRVKRPGRERGHLPRPVPGLRLYLYLYSFVCLYCALRYKVTLLTKCQSSSLKVLLISLKGFSWNKNRRSTSSPD
jgi:hypothetical protein